MIDIIRMIAKEMDKIDKELKKALQADKTIPSRAATLSHLIIWVLFRMDLLIFTRVQNRSHYYSVK